MDPNISPSGEVLDEQRQPVATATEEPPQAQTQAQSPQQVRGPFSRYLDPTQTVEPRHVASQQRPSGYMGTGGKIAYMADQLLGGLAKGRADAYNRSMQQQVAQYKRLDQAAQDIQSNPTLTDEDKQALLNKIYQYKVAAVAGATDPNGGQGQDGKKKGGKKGDDQGNQNPLVTFAHQAATRILGPGAQPQQVNAQSVNQVLGEVYSGMSQKVSAKRQSAEAASTFLGALGPALEESGSLQGAYKDPKVVKAYGDLLKTADPKTIADVQAKVKEMVTPKKAKAMWVERLPDGTTRPVTQEEDGSLKYQDGTPVADTAQIERVGTAAKQTEKQIELDRAYSSWAERIGKDKLSDGEKGIVADLERTPNSPLSEAIQANLLKQKGTKNLQLAKDQAILLLDKERQVAIAEKAANASLSIALKRLNLDDRKNKFNPKELDDVSRSIVNDVHGDGSPKQEAELAALRKSAGDPKDPKRTESAQRLRDLARDNVRDHPEFYAQLTDEQRDQVVHHINAMPVDKIVGRGGSAPSGALGLNALPGIGSKAGTKTSPPPAPAKAESPQRTPPPKQQSKSETITLSNGTKIETNKAKKGQDGKWYVVTGHAGGTKLNVRPATDAEIAQSNTQSQ